jgi:hypothetical protein
MSQTSGDKLGALHFSKSICACILHLCFSVTIPDGGNPLTQEEQSEYLLWKNVFSAVRHGRRNEVLLSYAVLDAV